MTSAMPVQCSNQLSYEVTQWRAGQFVGLMFSVKGMYMKEMLYAVRCLKSNEDMILALAGQFKQLSHKPEKFEPMTSAMPVQCSNQLSYEVTQWRAGQFVGLMFSCERNVYERNVICSAVFEIK